jgi:hypothetical protein
MFLGVGSAAEPALVPVKDELGGGSAAEPALVRVKDEQLDDESDAVSPQAASVVVSG